MRPVKVGVIGCGYWGPNLVRTFVELPEAAVVAVADRRQERMDHIRSRYPQIPHFCRDYKQLFDMDLDALVVSTPPETHHDIVVDALEHGLDVLVEKPLAITTSDALHLAQLGDELNRVVMVGHIGAYNPAVTALKEMVDRDELGEVRYVDAVRVGLGLFHPRLNVIWDLAPHDISILLYLLGQEPVSVSTRGLACVQDSVEDVAYMTLLFPSGVLAHARMSWLDPCKTRRITVVGERQMVVYDDLEAHEKIKIYDKHVNAIRPTDTFGDFQFAYHYGSVVSPYIEFEEPLRLECRHFADCVAGRKKPVTDAYNGVSVVRVIEAAQQSLREGGALVSIGGTEGVAELPDLRVIRELKAPTSIDLTHNGNGNGHRRGAGPGERGEPRDPSLATARADRSPGEAEASGS